MSTAENKKLLQDVFEQMSQGNTRALSDAMAEDCHWVIPGNWTWSGRWGPKAVMLKEFVRPLMAQFEDGYRSEPDLILGDGDRVVVQTRGYAVTKRGEPYHQTYCFIFTVADGRITEIVEHCDTALVERVLEPVAGS